MKATIKIVTAAPEFTEDQKQILRRVSIVLIEHGFSVYTYMKVKTKIPIDKCSKLKRV